MGKQMTFKKKVRSLTAKEMVETMIKGLEREWVQVEMATYGEFRDGICYGCAATNAVCEILQKPFIGEEVNEISSRAEEIKVDYLFLKYFEQAIDSLRRGNVEFYNNYAKIIGMTLLPEPKTQLPRLSAKNYTKNLEYYKEYASELPNKKLKKKYWFNFI